jgi:hypothetical protein
MSHRADALASRHESAARALATFASALSHEEWHARVPGDGRKVGVVVHYVAVMYALEIQLAQALAAGKPITDVTPDDMRALSARHAIDHDAVTKDETLELLRRNSVLAAITIRALSDQQLDRAAPISLDADAPLTCQFLIEDRAVRQSYHHLALVRGALRPALIPFAAATTQPLRSTAARPRPGRVSSPYGRC